MLTSYNGQNIYTDDIGNMLSDEEWLYTWEHGRQLVSMYEYNNDEYGWEFTYDASGMRTKRSDGSTTYEYVYTGSQLKKLKVGGNTLLFQYGTTGMPVGLTYNNTRYYYVTNLQGDVIAILDGSGAAVVTYTYDAWGNILTTTDTSGFGLAAKNPLRYRGYVYDNETGLYYLQSRYYNPAMGRFICAADAVSDNDSNILAYNMFAYGISSPTPVIASPGLSTQSSSENLVQGNQEAYGPNAKFLMAFYGVDSPDKIPEMPAGAMIFVENITSLTFYAGYTVIRGRTVVFDMNRYCEYTFIGCGYGFSFMPLDNAITQGYVYGVENVADYCGWFLGESGSIILDAFGVAIAPGNIYAVTRDGVNYTPSLGASATYYSTAQDSWIYGQANMYIVEDPYQYSPLNPSRNV